MVIHSRKSWLTLPDAAKYLSSRLDSEVSEADILQAALEKQLKLSVDFVNDASFRRGKIKDLKERTVSFKKFGLVHLEPLPGSIEEEALAASGVWKSLEEADISERLHLEIHKGTYLVCADGERISESTFVKFDEDVYPDPGLWDLSMLGGEQDHIRALHLSYTNGPALAEPVSFPAWLEREDGYLYELLGPRDEAWVKHYQDQPGGFPIHVLGKKIPRLESKGLPDDCVIVCRRAYLEQFVETLRQDDRPEPEPKQESRILEAMGLLALAYAKSRGPDYRIGGKPKVSRLVDDMLNHIPSDVSGMGKSKLSEIVSESVKAWEARQKR